MASANVGVASGNGRRRSLDAEINLVPFIDLLSMCICFLLITAVWINVGAVQVKQSRGTEAAPAVANQLELEARFVGNAAMEFTFKKNGRVARKQTLQAPTLAELPALIDSGLSSWAETKIANPANPSAPSAVAAAMIYPKAGVSYGDLVGVMDALRKHQIVNLGVVPAGPGGN